MGMPGRKAVKKNLSKIIKELEIDFSVINGENAADDGRGITKEIAEELFFQGIDVITSGNHIWDKEETTKYIEKESRLLRPANLAEGSPGKGFGIFFTKNKKYKVGVINLMGNVFMRKPTIFIAAKKIREKIILKKMLISQLWIFMEKLLVKKWLSGIFLMALDLRCWYTYSCPNADTKFRKRHSLQTDIGMCGDYNSVIGMDQENSIKRFFKEKDAIKHYPSNGEGTLSGVMIEADIDTGLAKKVSRIIIGGSLVE